MPDTITIPHIPICNVSLCGFGDFCDQRGKRAMSQTDFHGFRHRAGCTYGACGKISRLLPEMTTSVYGFLETVADLLHFQANGSREVT